MHDMYYHSFQTGKSLSNDRSIFVSLTEPELELCLSVYSLFMHQRPALLVVSCLSDGKHSPSLVYELYEMEG